MTEKAARTLSPEAPAALKTLRGLHIGVISVILPDGRPYSAVVNVHVDDEFRFYFTTSPQTRKLKALLGNGHVALNMGFKEDAVDNFQIVGTGEVVKGASHWEDVFKALTEEKTKDQLLEGKSLLTSHYPFRHFPSEDAVVVMIEPSWIRWFHHAPGAEKPEHIVILGEL